MNINLAVKASQDKKQLKRVLSIAEKYDVKGLEIQEIIPMMKSANTEKRAKIVIETIKGYDIEFLAYHFPIKSRWDSLDEAKSYDLAWGSKKIIDLSKETIKEAVIVANKLDVNTYVPANFHLFRFVGKNEISLQEKISGLEMGEKTLINLKSYAEELCRNYGLVKNGEAMIKVTRENNPPDHGSIDGLLDYHPIEIIRTKELGIQNCLDFAHFQQYMNYLKYGKGELSGVDLDKAYYPTDIDWKFAIDILKDNILLIHVNDAFGYRKEGEGLEVGKGKIDYVRVFKLMKNFLENLEKIIFTIEIKDGHIYPQKIDNSIDRILKLVENV